MVNRHSKKVLLDVNGIFKKAPRSLLHSAGKKAASIACLLVLGMLICNMLPLGFASGNTFGVTTVGSTNYPTFTFGSTGAGANVGGVAGVLIASEYSLSVSGTVTQIGAYASGSGNWKLGIYADNSGTPGALLAANNNVNPVVAGNNIFIIGPVYLTAGTYWIAILTDSPNREYNLNTGEAAYILSYGFSNSLPTTFSSGGAVAYQPNDYVAYATCVQIEGYSMATQVQLTDNNVAIQSLSFYSQATGNFRPSNLQRQLRTQQSAMAKRRRLSSRQHMEHRTDYVRRSCIRDLARRHLLASLAVELTKSWSKLHSWKQRQWTILADGIRRIPCNMDWRSSNV